MGDALTDTNDLWAKYSAAKDVPQPKTTFAEREKTLAGEAANPDTVVGYLVNGMAQAEQELIGHLTAGRALEAKQVYDEKLNGVIDNNLTEIAAVGAFRGGGSIANDVVEKARHASTHGYNNLEFTLPDGRKTTVGQYFSNPDMYGNPGKGFKDNGFDSDLVDAMLSGKDRALSESLGYFMRNKDVALNQVPGKVVDPNHEQHRLGARSVYDNWGDITRVFGDGASDFARHVATSNSETGGFSQLVPSIVQWAEQRSFRTGLTGHRLVASVMGDYNRFLSGGVEGDPGQNGQTARQITPAKRRIMDATAVRAISQMELSGLDVELNTDARIKAMNDCMSLMARMTAAGYDVMNGMDGSGKSMISHFARHVANAGTPDARSGFVYNWLGDEQTPGFSAQLDSLITGGQDFASIGRNRSADVNDWLKVSKAAGGTSTCPQADMLASDIKDAIRTDMFPKMAGGLSATDAWNQTMRNPEAGDRLVKSIMDRIGKYIQNERACADIAGDAVRAVRRGTPLNLQTLVYDAAFSDAYAKKHPAAATALRNWYYASVAAPAQFADDYAAVLSHVQSDDGLGLNPRDAQAYMTRIGTLLAESVNQSKKFGVSVNPRKVLQNAMNSGYYYDIDPKTKEIRREFTAHLDVLRGDNPVGFSATNAELKRRYAYQQALRLAGDKTRQNLQIKRDDQESGLYGIPQ